MPIATSSVRRKAQLSRHRPDIQVHRVRGNVNSRIARLDEGAFDAMVLARAGLARIGLEPRAGETFDASYLCPAIGAGMIGVLAVQALRAAGCANVVAVDPVESRLKMASDMGATGVRTQTRLYQGVTADFFGLGATMPEAAIAEDDAVRIMRAYFVRSEVPVLRGGAWQL